MYKPRFFVNYTKLTLFASYLAHEYKRLGYDTFVKTYSSKRYLGIRGKYLKGYLLWLINKKSGVVFKAYNIPKRLVLSPEDYVYYYKFKESNVLNDSIKDSVQEFLQYGIIVKKVQGAL